MAFSCPDDVTALAHRLADAARVEAMRVFRSPDLHVDIKDDHSPVTIADRGIETLWRTMIAEEFPEHGLWGEEFPRTNIESEWQWIMDPIDGTKAFALGRASFGCLLGLHHATHGFILGVVDQPVLQWRWWAARGHGAFFNEQKLSRTKAISMEEARLVLTDPMRHNESLRRLHEMLAGIVAMRAYGGDCLNYTGLADGSMHVTFDSYQNIYDIAAVIPLIEETGGVITHLDGTPIDLEQEHDVLAASTPGLHETVLKMYRDMRAS